MTKEKLNEFMKKIDNRKKPKYWEEFVNKNTKKHNIILKHGKRAFCTYCQKYFNKDVLVHPYKKDKCPHCNTEYYVRNNNIRKFTFIDDIAFYCKVDKQIILRIFEIESIYNFEKRTFEYNLQEYARFIPNLGIIVNNSISFFMYNMKIYHNVKIMDWRIYRGNKHIGKMPIYPYNKKQLFKNTVYEYAPLKEFKENYKYYNEFEMLQITGYQSFELLWKMGLYKLSLSSKYFNKKGTFYKRFGLEKKFLKFMIKNNLDYDEYRVLKLLKEENIDLIRKYAWNYNYNYLCLMNKQGYLRDKDVLDSYYFWEKEIRMICKYMKLSKFLKYQQGVKHIQIYVDYLNMLKNLNYKMKCKDELFPKRLIQRHNNLMKKIKIMDDIETKFGAYMRYLELSKYTYENDKYIIFPAPSVEDMKDEGEQQRNCVARLYLSKYIKGESEIYFIREKNNITKSLITLEFKNGRVAQKELSGNRTTGFSKEQLEFIDNWVNFRNLIEQKEKFNIKQIKYDLKKLVA